MPKSDDDILAQELGKAGYLGGKVGGLFSNGTIVGKTAGVAGALGATFAARFLPSEIYSEKLSMGLPPDKALKLGFSVLTKLGALQTDDDTKAPYPMLKAVVGAGLLNMNPAVVHLEILEGDASACEITVTAAAKEGLIKQHTSVKAVQRVISALRGMAKMA